MYNKTADNTEINIYPVAISDETKTKQPGQRLHIMQARKILSVS